MAKSDNTSPKSPQTRNWYRDRYETALTQRNFLGAIALMSLALAVISTLVIFTLIPSKTVLPFLIQVDEKTGITQTIDQQSQKEIAADESLRKYFVVKYVTARESYDPSFLDIYSEVARVTSQNNVYNNYKAAVINPNNRESFWIKYGDNKIRQVNIKAVQFLDANRAQVRFSATVKDKATMRELETMHYVALIKFRFANLDLNQEERLVNPLGFLVEEYRVDEDSLL